MAWMLEVPLTLLIFVATAGGCVLLALLAIHVSFARARLLKGDRGLLSGLSAISQEQLVAPANSGNACSLVCSGDCTCPNRLAVSRTAPADAPAPPNPGASRGVRVRPSISDESIWPILFETRNPDQIAEIVDWIQLAPTFPPRGRLCAGSHIIQLSRESGGWTQHIAYITIMHGESVRIERADNTDGHSDWYGDWLLTRDVRRRLSEWLEHLENEAETSEQSVGDATSEPAPSAGF